jgi:hypothetical protein
MPKSARVSLSTLVGSEEDVRKLLGDSEHIAGNQCQFTQSDEMRRPVSGRDAVYAPKLSTCSKHR